MKIMDTNIENKVTQLKNIKAFLTNNVLICETNRESREY